jgi:archaellum component FlaF (FlaF/FlaG flagellin family)
MTYSSTLALGRQQQPSMRGQNSVSFKITDRRLGPVSNTIILIVLACLLGLLYLTQVTKTNSYGYKINALQQQQSKLQQQHEDLSVASARLQSVDQVASSSTAQGMAPVAPSGSVQ